VRWHAACSTARVMGVSRFEDLRVWQEAKRLSDTKPLYF
jgi:hypothetical protein